MCVIKGLNWEGNYMAVFLVGYYMLFVNFVENLATIYSTEDSCKEVRNS